MTTRRIAVEATKELGDAIVMRLEVGTSDTPSRRFHAGQPASTFTIGTIGAWKIEAPGVAPVHAYARFDGRQLFVATADPDDPATVDGRTVPETWLAVAAPSTLAVGGARLTIDSRLSSEFPAAPASDPSPAEAATRIDIEPLWVQEAQKLPQPDEPPPPIERKERGEKEKEVAPQGRGTAPAKALVFVVGAALVAFAAYRIVAMRQAEPPPVAETLAAPPAAAKSSAPIETTAPIEPPRAAPTQVALAPAAIATPAGKNVERTVEREAVDALTAGDFTKAAKLYRTLNETRPNQPAFKEALRILEERSHAR
jgi:hypothetical protein